MAMSEADPINKLLDAGGAHASALDEPGRQALSYQGLRALRDRRGASRGKALGAALRMR